jgi:hypothetical protein
MVSFTTAEFRRCYFHIRKETSNCWCMTDSDIFNVVTFQVKYEKRIDWVVDIRNSLRYCVGYYFRLS